MDSPQHIGDSTTNSISNQLSGTHLQKHDASNTPKSNSTSWSGHVSSAVYLGQEFLQLCLKMNNTWQSSSEGSTSFIVLRRVQDSYVNIIQMLHIQVVLGLFDEDKITAFLENKIFSNTQFFATSDGDNAPLFDDYSSHENPEIRGIWIPYDKAVLISKELNIYDFLKGLFLVDVHEFSHLPRATNDNHTTVKFSLKRAGSSELNETLEASPTKKRRSVSSKSLEAIVRDANTSNSNAPYTKLPLTFEEKDLDLVSDVKLKFSKIFKHDETGPKQSSTDDIKSLFAPIFEKCSSRTQPYSSFLDVPLDLLGKTALHYAATLASPLVMSFLRLEICSPIRGDNEGESPLISAIKVTNAMEKGNYVEMLSKCLWPNLWLFDFKHRSIFHHLILVAEKNSKSSKFYLNKTLEWMISSPDKEKNARNLNSKLLNAQEADTGNTALHLAGQNEHKWFIYVLLELNADTNIANNVGIKPVDFESVKDVIKIRETFQQNPDSVKAMNALIQALDASPEEDEYLVHLIRTGIDFLNKTASFIEAGSMEEVNERPDESMQTTSEEIKDDGQSSLASRKIFKSIQDLLENTNDEYSKVIQMKKKEINNLNCELRNATLITANNKYTAKKIMEKISQVDTLKLQITNITERLQVLKKAMPSNGENGEIFDDNIEAELVKFDADEPFIIKPIFDKLANNEDVEPTAEVIESLPSAEILQARLQAYRQVNLDLENELEGLLNYSNLTAKFKKVVSYCTGVDINEVDELLDGLLEAVEGQQ